MKLTASGILAIAGLAVAALAGLMIWRNRAAVVQAINPADPKNLANRAATAAVSAATGREETLGGWLADIFDPGTRKVEEMLRTPTQPRVKPVLTPADDPDYLDTPMLN